MTNDFEATVILLRTLPDGRRVEQGGNSVSVQGCGAASIVTVAEIEANPRHYRRHILPMLLARNAVALVVTTDAKHNEVLITLDAAQYALGAAERQRFAAWQAGCDARRAERRAAARAYDLAHNEGAEGFNPYRR